MLMVVETGKGLAKGSTGFWRMTSCQNAARFPGQNLEQAVDETPNSSHLLSTLEINNAEKLETHQHVALNTQRPKPGPVQAGISKVRPSNRKQLHQYQQLTFFTATTQKMAPSSATSTPAARSPRPSRPRWVPTAATRSSSTIFKR